ncbi:f2993c72-115a-48b0-9702-d17a626550b8 [Thermothielavioides terrestris]|uniref:Uncharacterized protein n=2 Tax=Thermothielavioides terrestris TaxID=2587410 RepID=G2QYP4_THETT|nr:uncharacterized protein THITE_2087708 [Thermothielavioides terrestris NRRL 8126]AEO66236.1 hypothetical protein THITE_2087708 [Thermothielavioides terrestris NRRL 8126]SPQ25344.1 f2993c72-115a-48b0-9702-d17a626550b8 [Thermothielavioides terrestris]
MGKGYIGPKPSYFLPSHFDYPPDVPVKLGNLITDLDDPGNPLNQTDFVPFNEGMQIPVTEVKKFKGGVKNSDDEELSLLAKAIYHIGLKARLKMTESHARVFSATLSRLQTQAIMPDDDYVERSMMTAEVQRKLKSRPVFRKPVFMITALKIAYPEQRPPEEDDDGEKTLGGSTASGNEDAPSDIIRTEQDDQSTLEGSVEANGDGAGVPGAVEAKGRKEHKSSVPASFVPVTPFIYAFAVRQCFYSWKKKPQGHRPYTKGALASYDFTGRTSAATILKDEQEDPEEMDFSFLEFAEDTVHADQLGEAAEAFETLNLLDDEDEGPCQLAIGKSTYQTEEE